MKVKTKCKKCNKTFYFCHIKNLKQAKAIKKLHKENGFTCWMCICKENKGDEKLNG